MYDFLHLDILGHYVPSTSNTNRIYKDYCTKKTRVDETAVDEIGVDEPDIIPGQ